MESIYVAKPASTSMIGGVYRTDAGIVSIIRPTGLSNPTGLRVFDVQVADGVCPGSTACFPFLTSRGTYEVSLGSSEQTRVWWFTMQPFAPIVVVATGPASTMENTDALIRSMGFGSDAEHPLAQQEIWEAGLDADLPAGRVALPALGGLEFDLPFPAVMRQS